MNVRHGLEPFIDVAGGGAGGGQGYGVSTTVDPFILRRCTRLSVLSGLGVSLLGNMSATPSVKILKSFAYRGGTRVWSNRYHFNGGTPSDLAHWYALFDAITTAEKAIFTSAVTIVEAVGYAAGSDLPVASKSYSLACTGVFASHGACPGNDAALVRYSTTARSAKNHPIYLFNYFHNVGHTVAAAGDVLNAAQKTAMETYTALWLSGFTDGAITAVRAGPNGATATSRTVSTYISHRDFPN